MSQWKYLAVRACALDRDDHCCRQAETTPQRSGLEVRENHISGHVKTSHEKAAPQVQALGMAPTTTKNKEQQ